MDSTSHDIAFLQASSDVRMVMVFNLASLGSVGPPTQAREEIFCFCFGNLGTLPLSELLAVNQCCQDGKNKAVTHV